MAGRLGRWMGRLGTMVPVDMASAATLVHGDLAVEAELDELLGDGETLDLFALRETMPRIRPILVALATRAAGAGTVDRELQHAAEILHYGLVVHDVALGREGGRRRRWARTVIKRSVDLVASRHLEVRALELARRSDPTLLGEVVDTMRAFADGQQISRSLSDGRLPSLQDWEEHAEAHTGALFAFCCRGGGRASAGGDPAILSALGRYGRHLGVLWHVAEDVSMIRHGDAGAHLVGRALALRPMYPVVIGGVRDPEVAGLWKALVNDQSIEDAEVLVARLEACGAVAASRERMAMASWSARQALQALPESSYRTAMERLASDLVRAGTKA